MSCMNGHFYAVGIGPGAEDLLTVRSTRLLASAHIVVVPRSEKAEESLALQIAKPWLGAHCKVVEHIYPMMADGLKAHASWLAMAKEIAAWMSQGLSVVQVTLGDPSVYSTSHYLLQGLRELSVDSACIHVVPGVSAFQAIAARTQKSLAIQRGRMMLMGADDMDQVRTALGQCETLVLYKCGPRLAQIRALLLELGLQHKAVLACYIEQGDKELFVEDWESLDPNALPGYLSSIIVYQGERTWRAAE